MLDILAMLDMFKPGPLRIPLIYLKVAKAAKVAKPRRLDMLMATFKTTSV